MSTQKKQDRKGSPTRNALQVLLKKNPLSGENLGKCMVSSGSKKGDLEPSQHLLLQSESRHPSPSLPSDAQIHSILCPASLCCCEVYELQWLGWDPSSQWRGDGTRGADPPECVLTWCWGRSDAPHSHCWPCWAQTGCHHCLAYVKKEKKEKQKRCNY